MKSWINVKSPPIYSSHFKTIFRRIYVSSTRMPLCKNEKN